MSALAPMSGPRRVLPDGWMHQALPASGPASCPFLVDERTRRLLLVGVPVGRIDVGVHAVAKRLVTMLAGRSRRPPVSSIKIRSPEPPQAQGRNDSQEHKFEDRHHGDSSPPRPPSVLPARDGGVSGERTIHATIHGAEAARAVSIAG